MEGIFEMKLRRIGSDPWREATLLYRSMRRLACNTLKVRFSVSLILTSVLFCFCFRVTAAQPTPTNELAQLKISGYGLLGNRQLKRILKTVELGGTKPKFYVPAFVEDSALILSARLKQDGFLMPRINIRMVGEDGSQIKMTSEEVIENPLPREFRITRLEFKIKKGKLYHYQELRFEGLGAVSDKEARPYFLETKTLFHPKTARTYTPERLKRSIANLSDLLDRKGYAKAQVEVTQLIQDDRTGAVRVHIGIQAGDRSIVSSVGIEVHYDQAAEPDEKRIAHPHHPYSRLWVQDFTQQLKTNLFHRGYPDATVELNTVGEQSVSGQNELDLKAVVKSGPQVRVGAVDFYGEKKTKKTVMSRRVKVVRGELLDRIKIEEGRYRLARMGSFESVDLTYQTVDDHTRDVLYHVKEGKELEVSLLFGYGSYELLRGGVEAEQFNIWGLGHRDRLKVIQSFKASSGEFTYTIPEFVLPDVDLFFDGFGLRREELSFLRVEYGGGFGGHRFFKDYATDLSMRYNYQILNAFEVPGIIAAEGGTNTAVGSIITDIKHDRRDNPLYPRHGYRVFANLEIASDYLGGEANYQRFELWTSWHLPLGGGRYLGLGLSHGVVLTIGSPGQDLPFNRRFFPGGENSIRGYTEGEASPRNAAGQLVGAETYTLGTVEIEQALTPNWSFVVFSDSLGFAEHAENYPFDSGLYSAGGGLRWKTIIGPVRFEYGHNLNPRPHDPDGTFQFSLGFPF
jgi:outer membrane protein insertion porin family